MTSKESKRELLPGQGPVWQDKTDTGRSFEKQSIYQSSTFFYTQELEALMTLNESNYFEEQMNCDPTTVSKIIL